MNLIALDEKDLQILKYYKPFLQEHMPEIVSNFYKSIAKLLELSDIINQYVSTKSTFETILLSMQEFLKSLEE